MDYIIRTLQSHHWGHCECAGYFLDQGNCKEISLENYECISSAQVGIWWVLCPCPCSVFAVYQPSTPPLAPSVSVLFASLFSLLPASPVSFVTLPFLVKFILPLVRSRLCRARFYFNFCLVPLFPSNLFLLVPLALVTWSLFCSLIRRLLFRLHRPHSFNYLFCPFFIVYLVIFTENLFLFLFFLLPLLVEVESLIPPNSVQ